MNKQFSETQQQNPGKNQHQADNFERSIDLPLHEMNASEGGEFLDDAIRMEDQQLGDTDEPTDEISLYVSEPFNEPDDK